MTRVAVCCIAVIVAFACDEGHPRVAPTVAPPTPAAARPDAGTVTCATCAADEQCVEFFNGACGLIDTQCMHRVPDHVEGKDCGVMADPYCGSFYMPSSCAPGCPSVGSGAYTCRGP
ncbi:MAG: hypothetical protein QM831_05655 [Kofleriaceae bacterium]